jgi:cation transport ATPase
VENSLNPTDQPLPALVVKDLTALPVARVLLQKIRSIVRQNTLATFLGTILILPVSSGIFIIMGGPFPAPWHVGLASLPGLLVSIANAVRMGREFLSPRSKKEEPKKEDELA